MAKISSKTINTILSMKDNSSKTLKNVANNTKDLERRTKKANNMVKKFGKNTTASMKRMAKSATKLAAVGAAATAVFAKTSVDAAQVQLENELKLATVLKQRTNATKEQIDAILALTAAEQANGVVGDEVQIAGAQQISTFVGQTSSVEALIPAMNNLLVQQKGLNGTTGDAVNIANLMGKALQGQTGALTRVGISFTDAQAEVLKYGTEEERAAMLAKVITDNVGEMNKEMAKTDAGAIQQAKNMFGDMEEEVGKMLLPYLSKFSKWFSKNLPQIQKKVLATTDKIIEVSKKIYSFIKKIYKFIMKYKTVITLIGILVATFATIITVITTVTNVIKTLTAVQAALNLTLGLCPIVWIIAGIALVVAAIVALVVYWDEVKAAAKNLWKTVSEAFGKLKEAVVQKFTEMFAKVKETWNNITNFLKHPIKGAVEIITSKKEQSTVEAKAERRGRNAVGTSYWKGGLTSINERGGEIINLPNGSKVIPADKSKKIMNNNKSSVFNININGVGKSTDEIINEFVPKLKLALANV